MIIKKITTTKSKKQKNKKTTTKHSYYGMLKTTPKVHKFSLPQAVRKMSKLTENVRRREDSEDWQFGYWRLGIRSSLGRNAICNCRHGQDSAALELSLGVLSLSRAGNYMPSVAYPSLHLPLFLLNRDFPYPLPCLPPSLPCPYPSSSSPLPPSSPPFPLLTRTTPPAHPTTAFPDTRFGIS